MSRTLLISVFGLGLVLCFAVAAAPARLAFDAAAGPAGARAGLVQGTVWDATILRLTTGGPSIAQTTARLQPSGLLSGAARFDVALRDPTLRGEGVVALTPGGLAVENASGVASLSRLALPVAMPAGESVRVEIERLAVDRAGRCREAEGRITTSALVAAGEPFGAVLPVLDGVLLCAGDAVGLQINGTSDALALSGRIRFEPSGPAWRIEAQTTDRDVVAALSVMGFQQQGAGVFELDSRRLQEEG